MTRVQGREPDEPSRRTSAGERARSGSPPMISLVDLATGIQSTDANSPSLACPVRLADHLVSRRPLSYPSQPQPAAQLPRHRHPHRLPRRYSSYPLGPSMILRPWPVDVVDRIGNDDVRDSAQCRWFVDPGEEEFHDETGGIQQTGICVSPPFPTSESRYPASRRLLTLTRLTYSFMFSLYNCAASAFAGLAARRDPNPYQLVPPNVERIPPPNAELTCSDSDRSTNSVRSSRSLRRHKSGSTCSVGYPSTTLRWRRRWGGRSCL